MVKIIFVENDKQEAASHDAEQAELEELFKIAEKLTEGDMERMKRACQKMVQMEDDGHAKSSDLLPLGKDRA